MEVFIHNNTANLNGNTSDNQLTVGEDVYRFASAEWEMGTENSKRKVFSMNITIEEQYSKLQFASSNAQEMISGILNANTRVLTTEEFGMAYADASPSTQVVIEQILQKNFFNLDEYKNFRAIDGKEIKSIKWIPENKIYFDTNFTDEFWHIHDGESGRAKSLCEDNYLNFMLQAQDFVKAYANKQENLETYVLTNDAGKKMRAIDLLLKDPTVLIPTNEGGYHCIEGAHRAAIAKKYNLLIVAEIRENEQYIRVTWKEQFKSFIRRTLGWRI